MRTDVGRTGSCPIVDVEAWGSTSVFEAWGFSQIYRR
jgi:hypothetical protein